MRKKNSLHKTGRFWKMPTASLKASLVPRRLKGTAFISHHTHFWLFTPLFKLVVHFFLPVLWNCNFVSSSFYDDSSGRPKQWRALCELSFTFDVLWVCKNSAERHPNRIQRRTLDHGKKMKRTRTLKAPPLQRTWTTSITLPFLIWETERTREERSKSDNSQSEGKLLLTIKVRRGGGGKRYVREHATLHPLPPPPCPPLHFLPLFYRVSQVSIKVQPRNE